MYTSTPRLKASSMSIAYCCIIFLCTSTAVAQVPKMNSYPEARPAVYLDFDGQVVKGTGWNWEGTINAAPSGLTEAQVTEIFNRVAEDFRIFNLNITTDPDVYLKAPIAQRARIIVTPSYQWYGHAGGVAFVNSFTWGDDTPAWVFTTLLDNNAKYIAEATSHEIGHTLGLYHQSTYNRSCELITEYAEGKGDGETGWAPIMGVAYYKNFTTWTYGPSIEGCKQMQNDIAIISRGISKIGLRSDDHGGTRFESTKLFLSSNTVSVSGLINEAEDNDYFQLQLTRKSRLTIKAYPSRLDENNTGANMDMKLTLVRNNGDTVLSADPKENLSSSIDTMLNAGTYFISVDGTSNANVSDYGSLGQYFLNAIVIPRTSTSPIAMKGTIRQNLHSLTWDAPDRESVTRSYLEYSLDGVRYLPIATLPTGSTSFSHNRPAYGNVYYRLRMMLPDSSSFYSNAVVLAEEPVSVNSTLVRDQFTVNSPGEFNYQLLDETGRLLKAGRIVAGANPISITAGKKGFLVLKVFGKSEQYVFRLIKQ